MNEDFYIGWEARAPRRVATTARKAIALLLAVAALVPAALAVSQRTIGRGVFEWGTHKTVTGILQVWPYPHLLVPRPGQTDGLPGYSAYYLVAIFKYGLDPEKIRPYDGKTVAVTGTLIYRDNQTMIETKPEWIEAKVPLPGSPAVPETVSLGTMTMSGEIVDSKCYLGVMNPGQFVAHRACAIRCISGGCPPLLVVRQAGGPAICLLLVSADGKPVNKQVLDMVAEPLKITGEVEKQGDLLILRADPATYRRVGG